MRRTSRTVFPALLLLAPLACGGSSPPPPPPPGGAAAATPHARFEAFADHLIHDMLAFSPSNATTLGDHTYDARWDDVSVQGDAVQLKWIDQESRELAALAPALGPEDREDASILQNFLDQARFQVAEERDAEQTPMFYTNLLGNGLDPLVSREFAPLDVRMRSLRGRLEGIPAILAVAKQRLKHPPRVATDTAIEQTGGLVGLCDQDLATATSKLPAADQAGFEAARKAASAALKDFKAWMETDLLARSDGSFRAGKEAFTKIVRFTLDDPTLDVDALEADARRAMAETRAEMLKTAQELWPTILSGPVPQAATDEMKKSVIKAVLDKLAEERPTDQTLLADSKRMLSDATAFVGAKGLVTLPTEPVKVIEMPEYKRGVAVAYCDSAGPLEANPETLVAVAPAPASWPEARRVSQYKEYNESMLAELLVHEAMPGHYLQLMHADHVKDRVRSIFGDGAYIEGWAVYSEWLMAKYGFGGAKVRMQRLKMFLRAATNTVLDHEIHAGNMEEKDALALMMNEGFQEEGEAVGKWRRARLTKGQLSSYYYGFREFMRVRGVNETKPGFAERAYNDQLLALGAPPMRIVRARFGQ